MEGGDRLPEMGDIRATIFSLPSLSIAVKVLANGARALVKTFSEAWSIRAMS